MVVDEQLDQTIRTAIAEKRLIRFQYKGKERICEPHDYGIQKGIVRLHCWQIAGASNGRLPGWRLFDVIEMKDFEMLDRHFPGNREVASGKHHQWNEIFVRVARPQTRRRQ